MERYSSQSTLAPAEHQKEYTQGQIIKFDIPAFYGFIDPRQSFLRMNVELVGECKLRLSKDLGSQALISSIRIYDHSNSQLLENIENYGELVKILNVYGDNQTLKHQRQLLEAVDTETKLGHLDLNNALFFNQYSEEVSTTTEEVVNKNIVQVAMKIHSGILGGEKVFPVNAFGGLRVEIELNRAVKAVMMAEFGADELNCPTLGAALGAGAENALYLNQKPNEIPFVIGQTITVKVDAAETFVDVEITGIEYSLITGSALYGTKITFAAATIGASAIGSKVFYHKNTRVDFASSLNFKLTNVEMCLKQVNPPASYVNDMTKQMGSEEGLSLDVKTFDLVRSNIQAGQLINEQPIRSFSNRVYSVLSVLVANDGDFIHQDSFISVSDGLKKYSYAIDGKKNPNRDVETGLTTNNAHFINQQSTFELQKALESCGITIRELPVKKNFLVGRAMGRYGGVFNLKEHNLTLRTEYETATSSLLCLNYLCSLRRLNVSNKGIQVIP
tara:strand:+ start:2632 stop:4137 length:1506 start_codon:yes stop_codon:yes gene_type:complete